MGLRGTVLFANSQEYGFFSSKIPSLQKAPDLFTDFADRGLERNRAYERKDIKDAMASIIDGRIFDQLKELSKNADEYEPFVIIEGGGFYDFASKRYVRLADYFASHPDRELSFYTTESTFRAFGVGLITTTDSNGTARFLIHEDERLGKPKEHKEFPERGGFRKDWPVEKQRDYMMECFGPTVGKAFNTEYGSINGFYNRMELSGGAMFIIKDLSDVKLPSGRRIGDVKAHQITRVLGLMD